MAEQEVVPEVSKDLDAIDAIITEAESDKENDFQEEFGITPSDLAAVEAARRGAVEILASLSVTLYDIEPLGPWAIVRKRMRGEVKTTGGITIQAEERSSVGEVVYPSTEDCYSLQPGQLVLYSNFSMDVANCEELTGEKQLHLVRREEIFARLNPRPKKTPELCT